MDPELVLQQFEQQYGITTADKLPGRYGNQSASTSDIGTGSHTTLDANTSSRSVGQGSVEPETNLEYVDQTPKRPRRTKEQKDAEDELAHHWVTVLSIDGPAPRHFGDNTGMLPIWVEKNADWRQSGAQFHRQQTALRAVRLTVLGCHTDKHAARLKASLDEALHGRQQADGSEALLNHNRFRNGVDFGNFDAWWGPVLQDALVNCQVMSRGFEVFGRTDHDRMVAERARQIMDRDGW